MSDFHIQQLCKSFDGTVAVDNLSFTVPQGTIYGLLGPNGAGKTTTIRMLMGILEPDAGEIFLGDDQLDEERRRTFGYLPEERGLYQKAKVSEVLLYFLALKGLKGSDAKQRVHHYLEHFNLADRAYEHVDTLSKGNQQKIQFITAIAHHPEVLVLDEPFTGLDPVNQIILKETMQELATLGTTIILSTHQMEQVEKLCRDICLINQGKKVLEGALTEVRAGYGKEVRVAFEEAVPDGIDTFIDVTSQDHSVITGQPKGDHHRVLAELVRLGPVTQFSIEEPSLESIFIQEVREQ